MNRLTRTATVTTVAGSAAALLLAAAPTASAASQDVEREKHGTCTSGSTWKLDLDKEHGRIDVDFDVETRSAGDTWTVKVKHKRVQNGKKWVSHSRAVTDREGELEVDRNLKDRKGTDKVVVRVKSSASGEVCRAALKI
jgi:hypothetical protein